MRKPTLPTIIKSIFLLVWSLCLFPTLHAQKRKKKKNTPQITNTINQAEEKLYNSLEWRSIGPFRGGRSAAVTGVPGKTNLFYMGTAGGGVWKTTDGGGSWSNISDGFFGGSIGSIAVSESDNNVLYAGGGEVTVRGNVSYGYGIWKSENAGKTWTNMGLKNSRHIPRIRIHPKNSNIVFAAVLGDLFKSSNERGVYRSLDGGKTWKNVLFANADAGAVDLTFDPSNPRILFASTWRVRRTPYSLSSGGEGSALWKSTDGGDTWTNISTNKGLPKGVLGIIGVTVSPVNPNRVFAIIENENGGVFRSDDGGEKWTKVNSSRALRQRAWYYSRIYADSKDADIVYVMNVRYHKSKDGGRTFKAYNAPHGDHHDLWIAPEDNQRMIIADDGGGQITFDGGNNWSSYHNQPTAQFYRVTTDNHFPYRIYAAQQDNSTIRILHRTSKASIDEKDWEATAGGESAHIAIDPTNNDIVYGGSYGGFMTRVNHETEEVRAINVWPDNPMGSGAEGMKYRFQWNFPILFSIHDNKKLYTASNHLHVSYDEGNSWKIISPDLTRNDSSKLVSSGGPITQDNTGVEYYCTIFAVAETPLKEGVIWAGSDDGLIHVTKDNGKNWTNVTPPASIMPEWIMINSIDADPFHEGGVYVAATNYKNGDYQPYLYKTENYGASWRRIDNGIDRGHFTRVVRADPKRKGLLYAGTESGMYISFDDGNHWQSFQLNLPLVPITDLTIKNNNLIAATQGRSLWMIDDLTVLHQYKKSFANNAFHLYQPKPTYRMRGFQNKKVKGAGINHPTGVMVHFYLKEAPDTAEVKLSFLNKDGSLIREYSTKAKEKKDQLKDLKAGGNLFVWNTKYPDAKKFDGMIFWWGSLRGPSLVPGEYLVKLAVNGKEQTQNFEILKDPRTKMTIKDMQAQFDFINSINDKVSEAHDAIIQIREIREQLNPFKDRFKDDDDNKDLLELINQIDSSMTLIEKELYQTKNRSNQDPLNFPIKLTNKLAHLNALTQFGDFPPTKQALEVQKYLTDLIDEQLEKYNKILNNELPRFNQLMKKKAVDAIQIKKKKKELN